LLLTFVRFQLRAALSAGRKVAVDRRVVTLADQELIEPVL
jgi:hypothetical protein